MCNARVNSPGALRFAVGFEMRDDFRSVDGALADITEGCEKRGWG